MLEVLNEILTSEEFIVGVVSLVGAIFTALANRAVKALERKTGIQIEEKHMRVLHEAVRTGVESAMRHGMQDSFTTVRAHVVAHLKESAPDMMAELVPGEGVIDNLVRRYTLEAVKKLAGEPK